MDAATKNRERHHGVAYRIEVRGTIPARWSEWFGAESLVASSGTTVLHLRVSDQSELYGRLRRIHDLNLRLISVQRVGGGTG